MIVDDVKIKVIAGSGGDGAVAFNKNLMEQGPVGGTGGNAGSIFAEGILDIASLNQFRFKKLIKTENGEKGQGQSRNGNSSEDVILKLPIGTVIHNLTTGKDFEVLRLGEKILIVRGGRGGRGNYSFRSSTNTTPKEFEKGSPGQSFDIRFELKLVADIGLIGLPNAGKSSLLNELTNSKSKVADYPFTTLEPSLGVYFELVLADIPGLIEGAAQGKGLGIKFLRHVERTKILFHLIDADSKNVAKDYQTIRQELGEYNKTLLDKKEYVFLSKCDNFSEKEIEAKLKLLKKINPDTYPLSIIQPETLKKVTEILNLIKTEKIADK
ncbi:TPA: GTPase ObgE [Patescibacteria group bacterium]|nr:GTPase ObgE [Patescibacteria group bacterium]